MNKIMKYSSIVVMSVALLFGVRHMTHAKRVATPEQRLSLEVGWFFREGKAASDNVSPNLFKQYTERQTPHIMCISCADSRVPAIWQFNNVFKVCTAGNNITPVKGSVEFGRDVLNIPATIVVGHSNCGAIKAAMAGTQDLPPNIKKEIDMLVVDKNKTLNENIVENVHRQIEMVMNVQDDIKRAFVGAVYDHSNDFGKGYGAWIIVNLNGEKDPVRITSDALFEQVGSEIIVLD